MIEQTNFVRSHVFLLDHMIEDRPYKWPCSSCWLHDEFWKMSTFDAPVFGNCSSFPPWKFCHTIFDYATLNYFTCSLTLKIWQFWFPKRERRGPNYEIYITANFLIYITFNLPFSWILLSPPPFGLPLPFIKGVSQLWLKYTETHTIKSFSTHPFAQTFYKCWN